MTGFLSGDQARGRPVGVGFDGTGALLVADDAGNTVQRVAAADGGTSDAPVATDTFGPTAREPSPPASARASTGSPATTPPTAPPAPDIAPAAPVDPATETAPTLQ